MNCWICGQPATTAEHKTKRSDLKTAFGTPSQKKPLYYHDAKARNQRLSSLNSKLIVYDKMLCDKCNNTRTQPFDRAWEKTSNTLRNGQPNIQRAKWIRGNRVFPYDTRRCMIDMHLYFVKMLGCAIAAGQINIDLGSLAAAILSHRPHPNVYLRFGQNMMFDGKPITGMSNVDVFTDKATKVVAFARFLYQIEELAVKVMFALDGEHPDQTADAWHPKLGTNKLVTLDFDAAS